MAFNFKDPEEVKQYLHNLNIEYHFGCYKEKNPEVCHLLGDYLESIDKNIPKSGEVYKANCDASNFMKSCHKYGKFCLLGKGLPAPDYVQALKYLKLSCDGKNTDGCLMAGMLLSGEYKGIKPDPVVGLNYIRGACENRNAFACYYLSGMYLSGVNDKHAKPLTSNPKKQVERHVIANSDFVLPQDIKKAFDYSLIACNLENKFACANLSQMYQRGEGVEMNETLADKYRKKALRLDKTEKDPGPEIKFS